MNLKHRYVYSVYKSFYESTIMDRMGHKVSFL